MEQEYILDISLEAPERQKLRIGGVVYELAVADDFTPGEFMWIADAARKISALFNADYSEAGAEKLKSLLEAAVSKIIVDVPQEIVSNIPAAKQFKIVQLFSDAVEADVIGGGLRQDSEKSSPGYSASTEELLTTGSVPESE